MSTTAIVVGAGNAGAELALQLREQGWSGDIVLYGEETRLPYHRPPLSKTFMTGSVAADQLAIRPQAAYDKAQVRLVHAAHVQAIDPAAHRITLADGSVADYAMLALTTGARPRRLALPGLDPQRPGDNLHVLRTLDDAHAIRARCLPGSRLLVIGAGYIGLELAASATALGARVTVLEALPRVLARVTGTEFAAFIEQTHRAAGVDLRLGVRLERAECAADGSVRALVCADGSRIECDLVVAGIGVEPNVELARDAGLAIDNGIVVDELARTSATDVVAAGDCTNHPSALYGRNIRLESVPNALEQARTAAATLAGKVRPYRQAPWFWSDQFDLKTKSVGLLTGHDRTVLRGDPATRSFAVFYLQGERILAVDTVNNSPDFLAAKRIVGEDIRVPAAVLGDSTQALKDHLPAPRPAGS